MFNMIFLHLGIEEQGGKVLCVFGFESLKVFHCNGAKSGRRDY